MVAPSWSVTVTVAPGSPVPVMVGVLSVRVDPSVGAVMTGAVGALVSTVMVTGADGGETFPAGSVWVAVSVVSPCGSGVVGVTDQVPPAPTVVVPMVAPVPSLTVTVAPGSPVPLMVGVVSLVDEPSTGAVITGAAGAVVSTVKLTGADGGETFPAGSVWVAVSVVVPCGSGVVGVTNHVPPASTVAVPMVAPVPSVTVTVAPGSPVPVIVGVVSLVDDPSVGAVMTGAAGAVVSIVKVTGAETGETLPAGSAWVAVTVTAPSASGVIGVSYHAPPRPTVAVPIGVPPALTVTVAPGSPVPVMVGVLSVRVDPSVGAVMTGAVGALVSTVMVTGAEGGETFPAGSVWVAIRVVSPWGSGVVGVSDQVPPAPTVADPIGVPPAVTVTVAPASPVPLTVGVSSLVTDPSTGAVITGAAGAAVSTVMVTGAEGKELFPAGSVWVAVRVVSPSGSGVVGVTDHVPPASTVVVPIGLPSWSVTVTVAPGSPVPVMVGVLSFVDDPSAGAVITGAAGGVVSTVKVTGAEGAETLPARSAWVAVSVVAPSGSGVVGVSDHAPPASTVAVPIGAPPALTVTVAPGSPVPVIVGVLSVVVEPSAGAVITGAAGVAVSIVKVTGADVGEMLPARSAWIAVMVVGPSGSGAAGV